MSSTTDLSSLHVRSASPIDMDAVSDVSVAVNAAHRFIYFVPEAGQQAAELGVTERMSAYFAFRAAPLGAVPWQVITATFYNFNPRATQAIAGMWDIAEPARWQAARFAAVGGAMRRVGVRLTDDQVGQARTLIDPVIASADLAGKPLAAANAAVALPEDPLVALWQQITVLREWRGDAHLVVLAANRLGPCDCNVIQCATGRFPVALARSSRQWNDDEWAAATGRLVARGWLDAGGNVTETGTQARQQIEVQTDELCAPLWEPVGDDGARRLASIIAPINDAFAAAGTYDSLR